MPYIIFISELTAFPTAIEFFSLFAIDRATRHILRVRLLVTRLPVPLDPFEVLYNMMQCDGMRNELWDGSTTASLNIIFLK